MILRNITAEILTALADRPVVLLHGARQTGKTTLVKALAQKEHPARYVTLDDAAVFSAAQTDPFGFLSEFKGPVILDEVQRAPELFLAIKRRVDDNRTPGQFLLTGSAHALLLPKLSESLAGRMEMFTLWPFSQGELEGGVEGFIDTAFDEKFRQPRQPRQTGNDLHGRITRGGFPEAAAMGSEERRRAWFGSFVTAILQRDIRELAHIDGLGVMPRLLALIASRLMGLLNFADLSRSSGLTQSTVKRYVALLEATFLVQTIPAWFANFGKRLTKSPKIVVADTGLAAHLLGLNSQRLLGDRNLFGPLLEGFVGMELKKQCTWSRVKPGLFHFRSHDGSEVDFILEAPGGRLVGVEVKASTAVANTDFKGLRYLADRIPKRFHRGIVLYTGAEMLSFGPKLHAVPLPALWQWWKD
ncbi:MAG: ATP-binding protein [Desulfobacterales bacterium]